VPAKVRLMHHSLTSKRTEPSLLLEVFQSLNNFNFKRADRPVKTQKEDPRKIQSARLTMLKVVLELQQNALMLLFAPSRDLSEFKVVQDKVLD
jgi:hypothetical protein